MTGMHTVRCGKAEYVPTKIVCVGRNFPNHVKEMGGSVLPAEPVIFIKPNSSVSFDPAEVIIPSSLGLLHHEVELCALMRKCGRDISQKEAESSVFGYAVGIDFTLRERQAAAKKAGEPWTLAKGFDASAVFGKFVPSCDLAEPFTRDITLSINGEPKQRGNMKEMLFAPAEIISFVSRFMTIEEGDVLMCGTPAGVGEVRHHDLIDADIDGLPPIHFRVIRDLPETLPFSV